VAEVVSDRKARRQPPRAETSSPEYIEPESTQPVDVEAAEGFDSIPPPIQHQLRMLAAGLDRTLSARQAGERLDRIDANVAGLAKMASAHEAILTQMVVPGFKDCVAATDTIAQQMPRLLASVEATALIVGGLDKRLRDLEMEIRLNSERYTREHEAMGQRISRTEARSNDHELRLKSLETASRDATVATHAISKRDKKLIGIATGVGAVATFIVAKWSWWTSLFH